MLDLAVMHLARLVGEALADIVGILDDVVAQFLQLGAQLALLRHQQWRRSRSTTGFRGRRHGSRTLAALLAHDPRRHDGLFDAVRPAQGAAHELAFHLRVVGGGVLEPAFERVIVLTAERVSDHADPRTRCRCSGPALGSATLKRRPCCSEGTVLRAVSTFEGSILAMNTPGSTPPSASTSPQGAMISE